MTLLKSHEVKYIKQVDSTVIATTPIPHFIEEEHGDLVIKQDINVAGDINEDQFALISPKAMKESMRIYADSGTDLGVVDLGYSLYWKID